MNADGLINPLAQLLTDLQVLGRKPTAHNRHLQIGMRENLRPDIPSFHYYAPIFAHLLLFGHHPLAHRRVHRDSGGRLGHIPIARKPVRLLGGHARL